MANKVIVPESFPQEALEKFGAKPNKTYRYEGFKEQVYLDQFELATNFASELTKACGSPSFEAFADKVVVTVRTPPALAAYHQFENDIFPAILEKLNNASHVFAIVLPRTQEQKEQVLAEYSNLCVPKVAVDGRDLCAFSDMVISAGGTMNREAALLGTPVWSTFAGEQPAVDKVLQDMGLMKQLTTLAEVKELPLDKKPTQSTVGTNNVLDAIVGLIVK